MLAKMTAPRPCLQSRKNGRELPSVLAKIREQDSARFLWEHAREGMAILSRGGIIEDANPALCKMLGYADVQLIGMHFTEVTVTKDVEADSIKFKQLIDGEINEYSMGKTWRAKHGRQMPGELFVTKFVDGVLIYGAVMPVDPVVRAAMGDKDAEQMMDQALGRWVRAVFKNWRFWAIVAVAVSGALGIDELLKLLNLVK